LALVGLAATQSTNVEVRVAAFQCLVEIASLYYNHLRQYMTDLFALTTAAIQREAEPVACQALEFWATVAEEELSRQEENEIVRSAAMMQTCLIGILGVASYLNGWTGCRGRQPTPQHFGELDQDCGATIGALIDDLSYKPG